MFSSEKNPSLRAYRAAGKPWPGQVASEPKTQSNVAESREDAENKLNI